MAVTRYGTTAKEQRERAHFKLNTAVAFVAALLVILEKLSAAVSVERRRP